MHSVYAVYDADGDLVIKYVKTGQRAKPDHWNGISTKTDKEG